MNQQEIVNILISYHAIMELKMASFDIRTVSPETATDIANQIINHRAAVEQSIAAPVIEEVQAVA